MADASAVAIQVRGLVKRYQDIEALAGIDLTVASGEMFALLGPNGAGKTTLFSILSTLRKPTAGEAFVLGRDVVRDRTGVRQQIGIVFQDPALDQRLSARHNLELMGRFYGLSASAARRRTDEMLDALQLRPFADRAAQKLSGGQRRRLELARALVADPPVLFLDEATLGLDVDARRKFWAEVRELVRRGRTVFFTTHYMEEADVADRIALIDRGRIVGLGSPQQLKASVGGGVIRLATEDDEQACRWLREHGYAPEIQAERITLVATDAAALLPTLLRDLPLRVLRVEVREPLLEDVFLSLTGRGLGEGDARTTHMFRQIGLA
jgi:ABC-2 type transport system ATP-binding protein